MSTEPWTVAPHRPIQKLSPRVWRVEGDLPGAPLKRVMTIIRRTDGTLVVHSAIALGEEGMKEIDAWGKVAFIVVPNGFHRLDAKRYAERYPDAKVICPKGSRAKVEELVKVHGTVDDFPADEHVSMSTIRGVGDRECMVTVKDEDGVTLVLTDLVFNMPHVGGFGGFVMKHLANSSGGPRVSNVAKMLLLKDKKEVAAQLRELADTKDLKRVVVAHHEVLEQEPAATLRAVAATLS